MQFLMRLGLGIAGRWSNDALVAVLPGLMLLINSLKIEIQQLELCESTSTTSLMKVSPQYAHL